MPARYIAVLFESVAERSQRMMEKAYAPRRFAAVIFAQLFATRLEPLYLVGKKSLRGVHVLVGVRIGVPVGIHKPHNARELAALHYAYVEISVSVHRLYRSALEKTVFGFFVLLASPGNALSRFVVVIAERESPRGFIALHFVYKSRKRSSLVVELAVHVVARKHNQIGLNSLYYFTHVRKREFVHIFGFPFLRKIRQSARITLLLRIYDLYIRKLQNNRVATFGQLQNKIHRVFELYSLVATQFSATSRNRNECAANHQRHNSFLHLGILFLRPKAQTLNAETSNAAAPVTLAAPTTPPQPLGSSAFSPPTTNITLLLGSLSRFSNVSPLIAVTVIS